MYKTAPIFAEETESSEKTNAQRLQWRRSNRKTVNVFGISRISVSAVFKSFLCYYDFFRT